MLTRIIKGIYIRDYKWHLRFADGAEGNVDLKGKLDGPIFKPLKNPEYFRQFTLHPEFYAITWPNGADFAPEFLYEKIQVSA